MKVQETESLHLSCVQQRLVAGTTCPPQLAYGAKGPLYACDGPQAGSSGIDLN